MRYKVGDLAHANNCPNPECDAQPATGLVAEPIDDNWFFNCSKCGYMIKVVQQPD